MHVDGFLLACQLAQARDKLFDRLHRHPHRESPALPLWVARARRRDGESIGHGRCHGRPRLCSGGSGLTTSARSLEEKQETRGCRQSKGKESEGMIQKGYSRGSPADDSARPGGAEPFPARAGSFYGAAIKRRFCVDQNLNLVLGPRWRPGPGSDTDHTMSTTLLIIEVAVGGDA